MESRELFKAGSQPIGVLSENRALGWSAVGEGCPEEIRSEIIEWRTAKLEGGTPPEPRVYPHLSAWTQDAIKRLAGAL